MLIKSKIRITPWNFLSEYWYSPRSIWHDDLTRPGAYGFWIVGSSGEMMHRVNLDGSFCTPSESIPVPSENRGWFLSHIVPSQFMVHPILEDYNREMWWIYQNYTDEMRIQTDVDQRKSA